MKLYQQLILFVLAATAIPLVVGLAVLKHNEGQLAEKLLEGQRRSAGRLAEIASRELREPIERVQSALGYVAVERMTREELVGLMGIVYKQSDSIVQTALVDSEGREVVEGVYLDDPESYSKYAGRRGVGPQQHRRFLARLPLTQALRAPPGSAVLSRPYRLDAEVAGLVLAVPLAAGEAVDARVAAVEVSLADLGRRLREAAGAADQRMLLVDGDGRAIAADRRSAEQLLGDRSSQPAVARMMAGSGSGALARDGMLHAFARVEPVGWGVLLSQPHGQAFAEVRRSRLVTLAWTGATIAILLLLGLLFTGRITRDLRRLVAGAEAFSRGALDTRVEGCSADELGRLAQTFNQMGEELQASRAEIEAWNRELAARVEQRTRELEIANRRLLETSKLAAIGQLGAGVAHEINNPLVGILGNAQLLLLRHGEDPAVHRSLQKIEAAAKRCRDVVQNLLRFSEQEPDAEHQPCDLNAVLRDAHSLTAARMAAAGIEVEWDLADDLPVVPAAPRQLMQVFLNLYDNARTAMQNGGKLRIGSRRTAAGEIEISIADEGRGIDPQHRERIFEPFFTTKDVWTNTGLGLSVAFRIVSDHGGRIEVDSQPDAGAVFRVVLPVPAAAAPEAADRPERRDRQRRRERPAALDAVDAADEGGGGERR